MKEVSHADREDLITVVVPAFNVASYISEALDSVFMQTYTSYEVIVVNDGSADTAELEQQLERFGGRIVYLQQKNRGAAAARNAALQVARGKFVAFLDADDRWLPAFLEEQIRLLELNGADLVYSDALLFGDSPLAGKTFMKMSPSRGEVTSESLLNAKVTVLTSAVLARKRPILEVGLFDECIRRGHDFDLWLRLVKHGVRVAYHSKVLVHHRILESGLSGNTISQLKRTLTVLEVIHNRGGLTSSEKAALRVYKNRTMATLALETGKARLMKKDFVDALDLFKEANSLHRSWKLIVVCLGLRIAPNLLWRLYRNWPSAHAREVTLNGH
jgi:glycosyltransferase involved in cell wall biosynthesis